MKLNKKVKLLIAADGGAASGKSSCAKAISKKYGLNFLSSGLLYRLVAKEMIKRKHLVNNSNILKSVIDNITQKKLKNRKLFDPEVTSYTSIIAKSKKIRKLLKKYQEKFAMRRLACIEGRDIATVVCPHADIKIFFKCSLKDRAKRRLKDYKKTNGKISLKEVKKALQVRDFQDTNRRISPLRPSKNSIIINTSKLNKKQTLFKLSGIVESKLEKKYGKNYKIK